MEAFLEKTWKIADMNSQQAYLKAIRDIQFRGGDPHEIIHQHHDHDGNEHSKIADGWSHLQNTKQFCLQYPFIQVLKVSVYNAVSPADKDLSQKMAAIQVQSFIQLAVGD